ncbi:MAG: hypothetical protein H7Z16_16305 [Pyrinomonadaceae bacterium]|nr:hypothetical protein [Pyrinomonadaceae bacterium]
MLDQRKQQRLRSALPLLLAVLPAIYIGFAIPLYAVDTPLWDEWLIGGYLDKFSQGTLTVHDLFEQQNEYRQFFPNLIFVALGWLTEWDVRSWMLTSCLLAGLVSLAVYHLGKWSLSETPRRAAWCWFLANLIIFSPVQYENWLQGQQLVYFLPIACFTTSLLVASAANLRTGTRFSLCALASVVSSFSSANGMLCWILLLPVLAWSSSSAELWRKKWWIAAWLAGFVGTVTLYFHDYHTPLHHDPLALWHTNPAKIILYFLSTLGRPLAPGRVIFAGSIGFVLLTLFGWCCLRIWKLRAISTSEMRRLLAWLMLGAYSILTAVLITLGRLEHDSGRDLAPTRYTTYTLYLPVALVYLIPMMLGKDSQSFRLFTFRFSKARVLTSLCVALVVLHLFIYVLGIRQMSGFRVVALYSKSCSMFVNVLDDKCLTAQVYPNIDVLKRTINPAERLGFIRPGLIKSNRVQDIASAQTPGPNNNGVFQSLVREDDGEYVASGWAKLPGRDGPADAVLLAYAVDEGPPIIFAIARVNSERDIVSALLRRGIYGDSRWSKSFSLGSINPERAKITAWGFDAYSGKAYKLTGVHAFSDITAPEQ